MMEGELEFFGDEGAGPEDSQEEIEDEKNQEAARLIRESTYGSAIGDLKEK